MTHRSIIRATEKQREAVLKWFVENVRVEGGTWGQNLKLRRQLAHDTADRLAQQFVYGKPKPRPEKARRP